MPRAGWCTDIHLDWLDREQRAGFHQTLRAAALDALLIGGDIGDAGSVADLLAAIHDALGIPVCFVLGNHDFYGGAIATVRKRVRALSAARPRLVYLTAGGVVRLSPKTSLVGHDSWADARFGDFMASDVALNDHVLIEDFKALAGPAPDHPAAKRRLMEKLQSLGSEAAREIRAPLAKALASSAEVFVLTHVPPFPEACCRGAGATIGRFLPHFASQAFGHSLLEAAAAHPGRAITVLCGHTHGESYVEIRPNLKVWTGGARYGAPALQRVFEV
jgi:hypothetical protein